MGNEVDLKIRYRHHQDEIDDAFKWDGYDKVNGILMYLIEKHVKPELIPARSRGGTRNLMKPINLIENGIDDVFFFDEESNEWVEIATKWLINA